MPCIQIDVRAILQWSKRLHILACNGTRPRPRHLIFSLKRDWDRDLPTFPRDGDIWKLRLQIVKIHSCASKL